LGWVGKQYWHIFPWTFKGFDLVCRPLGANKRLRQRTRCLGNGVEERATTQLAVGQAHHGVGDGNEDDQLWQPQIRGQSHVRELHWQTAC